MKILVIQKKMMGDVLMSSVIFNRLREVYPDGVFHYLIGKKTFPVVQRHPDVSAFLFFEGQPASLLWQMVRKEKYDIIIDAYSKLGTALLCAASGAVTVSFRKKYTRFFYSKTIERRPGAVSAITTTAIEHRLQLLEPLGIPFKILTPRIYLTDKEVNEARNQLAAAGIKKEEKLVIISAFGSTGDKTYPLPYMAQVMEIVAQKNVKLLINYMPHQEISTLYAHLSPQAISKIVTGVGMGSLRLFMAVCSLSHALVGNEGGSTNIAKALDVPVFAIFSPGVNKDGWDWKADGKKYNSVHVKDYLSGPPAANYAAFKVDLFRELLDKFLVENL